VLYGLFVLLGRPVNACLLLNWRWAISFGTVAILLGVLYPFPLMDLLGGLLVQGRKVASGGLDAESLWNYYVLTSFLPLWSMLFVVAFAANLANQARWLWLLVPLLWWFGPRSPAINYNLIALLPVLVLLGVTAIGDRAARSLVALSLMVGGVGIAQLSFRDALTVRHNGDTYSATRERLMADARDERIEIGQVPGFIDLMGAARPPARRHTGDRSELDFRTVDYFAVSGTPTSPCPADSADAPGLRWLERKWFNSTSGWEVYRCIR
jgi:hypothetical protein